jgi:hypothetical protein
VVKEATSINPNPTMVVRRHSFDSPNSKKDCKWVIVGGAGSRVNKKKKKKMKSAWDLTDVNDGVENRLPQRFHDVRI